MKHFKFTISSLAIMFCFFAVQKASAATEFVSTIRASGGDYSTLSGWEAAVNCDLTAATTKVFAHGGITGTMPDNSAVTGATSGATGTALHTTTDQILIVSIVGTFQSGEQIRIDVSNYVTISNAGDSAIAVAECYNDWPTGLADNLTISGWTTSATNYIKIYAPAGQRHNGWTWTNTSKNVYSGFALKENRAHWVGSTATLHIAVNDCKIDGLIINQNMIANQFGVVNVANQSLNILIEHSIIFNTQAYGQGGGQGIKTIGGGKISNTLIYDCAAGGVQRGDWGTVATYVYNSTIINCGYGIKDVSGYANKLISKNVLAKDNSSADFYSGPGMNVDYCASGDHTADNYTGANNRVSQTFTFTDETNDNFHLSSSDAGARNQGTNLSVDANYPITTDIDYQTRPAAGSNQQWDIGADQNFKATQVNSLQTNLLTNGLVGSWTFNGQNMDWSQSSAEARDASGQGNHGNVMNFGKEAVTPGIVGQGLRFDGVDDYVETGAVSGIGGIPGLTVCSWLKTTMDSGANINYQRSSDSNEHYWLLNKESSDVMRFYISGSYNSWSANILGTTVINNGSWYYVCGVYNSTSDLKLYINGISEGTITGTEPAILYNGGLTRYIRIGDANFNGSIDEARVYNRALSADEVGQLYRAGARTMKIDPTKGYNTIIN